MSATADLLAPFRTKDQPAPVRKPATGKQPYKAYELSKEEKRYLELRVKYPDPAECQSNAMLTNMHAEWRMGLAITLMYGNTMQVCIKGENLTELFRAIKDWKVEWLAEFDPEMHEMPTDKAAPFIESITINTTRPEEPPPVSKRH